MYGIAVYKINTIMYKLSSKDKFPKAKFLVVHFMTVNLDAHRVMDLLEVYYNIMFNIPVKSLYLMYRIVCLVVNLVLLRVC